ncbi:MAG: hypothetical protein LBQ14_01875 [Treponema sp.]|nr:hypothetical protein [Treponema sp.]
MDPVIAKAQKVMDKIVQDEALLHAYHMYELSLWDENSLRRELTRRCTKRGMERGIKQGIEQGKHKTVLEIARKLKARGLPAEQIAEDTGLLPEDIAAL